MKKIRVGVIGLGVGMKHVRAFESHPDCEMVAACDFSDDKLDIAKQHNTSLHVTKEAGEILDDPNIEVVSIASYDNYHFDQIVRALSNGKHVFVEKPLCMNFLEAVQIKKFLKENPDLQLSSNLNLRSCPRFIALRDEVSSGRMGDLFHVEGDYFWGRKKKLTEGWRKDMSFYSIVYGASVHMIDLILWITGEHPVEVQGYGNKIATAESSFRYNDLAVILMKFENNMTAKVCASGGCVHPHFHRMTAFGTKKTFVHEISGGKWLETSDPKAEKEDIVEEYPAKEEKDSIITSFVDSIINRSGKFLVPTEDIFSSMSVCFAAEKSIQEGMAVQIDYI